MKININKYGQGVPLVFFHGWGFDSLVWLPLVPKLIKNYQLFLVDLPGFGHSTMMNWTLFKNKLLSELPEQFALVGWSMGGLYAMRLALEEPSRVTYLVNITSSPKFLVDDLWPGVSKEVFAEFYQKLSLDSQATLNDFMALNLVNAKQKEVYSPPVNTPSIEALEYGLKVLQTWDFREELKHFDKPTVFMFGRLDPIVSLKTMNSMQHLYPAFNYVFFNRAAHMPFLSHSDLFIEELRGFIQ